MEMNTLKKVVVFTLSGISAISFAETGTVPDKVNTIKQMYQDAQNVGDLHEIGVLRRYSHPLYCFTH